MNGVNPAGDRTRYFDYGRGESIVLVHGGVGMGMSGPLTSGGNGRGQLDSNELLVKFQYAFQS